MATTKQESNYRHTWPGVSALAGLCVWSVLFVLDLSGGHVERILLFHVLVISPLALIVVSTPDRRGREAPAYRLALVLQPFAAALVVLSFLSFPGPAISGGLLILPWFIYSLSLAFFGLWRFLPRNSATGPGRFSEACMDGGFIFFPVGAVWLFASRVGFELLGFQEPFLILTAAHFHYAGFIAPIYGGLTGRLLKRRFSDVNSFRSRLCSRLYSLFVTGILLGTPLTAIGIAWSPFFEVLGATVLALSLVGVALLHISLNTFQGVIVFTLSLIGGLALIAGMGLACLYALGEFTGAGWINIPTMIVTHAYLNSMVFSFFIILAAVLGAPEETGPPPGIPFSRFFSRARVGSDFFAREAAIAPETEKIITRGLTDDLGEYRRKDFIPPRKNSPLRDFYENTIDYELYVIPAWRGLFPTLAKFYKLISVRVGQMNFPLTPESSEGVMDSRIFDLSDELDGRKNVRAWVRTYLKGGAPLYAAAYSSHSLGEERFMNIAFPYTGGNLTSVLRLENTPEGKGLLLSTLPVRSDTTAPGDQGVYFVIGGVFGARLPLNESIYVWDSRDTPPPGSAWDKNPPPPLNGTTERFKTRSVLLARHFMWLFGYNFLTLDYFIYPASGATTKE